MTRKLLVLLVVVACTIGQAFPQVSSNKGTEFWVGFMAHSSSNAGMYLYITSDSSTTGTVTIPGRNWSTNFTVNANSMTLVTVPTNLAYVDCSDCIRDQGIKVTSVKPIIVYSHIYYQYRSDATLVLPKATTGKEYFCMAYKQGLTSDRSQFMIIGQKDSTLVRITPTVDLRSASNGRINADKSYYIMLNEGEVYQGRAYSGNPADDITGTYIEVIDTGAKANCRTVSVFSGNSWTSLGCTGGFNTGDNLYEQMYPVNSWGNRFVTVPLSQVNSDNLRILAARDNTTVIVYNANSTVKVHYLNSGEYVDLVNIDEPKYIISGSPIMVAQYSKTQSCSGAQSDPSMTILNPIEQTLTNITLYSSQYEDIRTHYINVVIPSRATSSFRIDGNTVSFTKLPSNSYYSYAQIKVNQGNHVLSANEGFVATAYGFGQYESYGYAAGANVKDLTAKIELSNSSMNEEMNICLGQTAVFKGTAEYSVARWEWFFGDGQKDNVQNPKHFYKDTGVYQVKLYTYKTAFDGCSNYDSAFLTVRVSGKPVARIASANRCELGNVQYLDSSIAPPNDLINLQIWRFNTGADVYVKNPKRYYDTAGMYPVRLIVRTQYQCYDTIKDSVYINPLPQTSFTADKACQFDSVHFTNTSSVPNSKIAGYKWFFGDGDSSLKKDPSHFYQDSGRFIVTLTATSDSSCTSSFKDTVYKYPVVDLSFDYNDTCQDMTVNFTNTTNTSGAIITGMGWLNTAGDTSDLNNYSYTFDKAGKYDVTLWYEIDSFCKDAITRSVEIYPLAEPGFKHSKLCLNETVEFINTTTVSSGTTQVVSWKPGDGQTYYTDTLQVDFSTPGTKYMTLKVSTDKGCVSTLDTQFSIKEIDIQGITFSDTCSGSRQDIKPVYTLNFDNIDKWEWLVNNATAASTEILNTTLQPAGKYELLVNVTTEAGCFASYTDSIEIFENPTAQFTINPACDQSDFSINNTSFIPSPDALSKYFWYYNGKLASSAQNPSIKSEIKAPSSMRLIVESTRGCRDTLNGNVVVYPLPDVNFLYRDSCEGETTSLIDNSNVPGGSISASEWRFHDGLTGTGLQVTRQYPVALSYPVVHIITTNRGCKDSLQKPVTIHPLPVINISALDYDGCEPFTPEFVNTSSVTTGSIIQYDWTMGDGSKYTNPEPVHTYMNQGSYTVKVKATTDKYCVDSAFLPQNIVVYNLPTANFSFTPEKPSILESTLKFTDLSSSDVTEWMWDFGDGFSSYDQNPQHEYTDTGLFVIKLTVTNDNECENSAVQSFFLNPDLFIYIPSSFSPNGDEINDYFGAAGVTNGIKNFELRVYNRWGELIYFSDDAAKPWDGTYQGEPVPMGSYIYQMQFSDYKVTHWYFRDGEVLLLK